MNKKLSVSDSNGNLLEIGCQIKKEVTINNEVHGDWAIYEIVRKNGFIILSYVKSEKGQILPMGYLAQFLSDLYDQKLLLFGNDVSDLNPGEKIELIK